MIEHPSQLSDTLSHFIFACQMQNGKFYRGRYHVGLFKKEDDKVYFQSVLNNDWIVVNPHEHSLFMEVSDEVRN